MVTLWNLLFASGLVAALLLWVGCAFARAKPEAEPHRGECGQDLSRPRETDAKRLLRERLEALAVSNPPTDLQPIGAMCYDVAAPPERAEYVCPVCGERTLYGHDRAALIEWELPTCRRALQGTLELRNPEVRLALDESQFCRKCSPHVTQPALALVVSYPGAQEPARIEGIASEDLRLIDEFLAGSDRHRDEVDAETALSAHAHRIAELLDLDVPLTRPELTDQLRALAETDPPADLNQIGAMCYSPVALPDRAEFVCPECGLHTTYAADKAFQILYELPVCRRTIGALAAFDVRLDESEFCPSCGPTTDAPELALVVEIEGEEPVRVRGISRDDLALIVEFLEGSARHVTANDAELPLRDRIDRIRELIGCPGP